jgi:hypothetical protein
MYGANNYVLFLRQDLLPVAITWELTHPWANTVVSNAFELKIFSPIPLQENREKEIEQPSLDPTILTVLANQAKLAYEPWDENATNYVTLVNRVVVNEFSDPNTGAPQISPEAISKFPAFTP